jgi:hypothetical protein
VLVNYVCPPDLRCSSPGDRLATFHDCSRTSARPCRLTSLRSQPSSAADRARKGGSRWPGLARITPRDCALLLIAAAAPGAVIEAPAEAQRIGSFRLLRRDNAHVGRDPHELRSLPYQGVRIVTLVDFMAVKIERGADPDHPPLGWRIGEHEACDGTPDRLGDCIEPLTKLPMSLFADIAGLFGDPASRVFKDVRCVRSVVPQGAA